MYLWWWKEEEETAEAVEMLSKVQFSKACMGLK